MLIDSEIKRAEQIRAELQCKLDAVTSDDSLTREAKGQRCGQLIREAKQAMRELRAESDARQAGESSKAYRAAFGFDPAHASDERAYRAQLAKDAPSAGQALEQFVQAQLRGDSVAARGLAELAWQNRDNPLNGSDGWHEILSSYSQTSPAVDTALANCLIFDGSVSGADKFVDRMQTEIHIPAALAGLNLNAPSERAPGQPDRPVGINWDAPGVSDTQTG